MTAVDSGLTRRDLVRLGVAATRGDGDAIAKALAVEQLVVIAYRQVLSSRALEPDARQVQALLSQELEHLATLERTLRALGRTLPAAPADLSAAQLALAGHHVSASLTVLATRHDCLKLLIDLESLAEAAYFSAISKLRDPALIGTSLEIMGCEAQHWTLLSGLAHHGNVYRSVPYPFVQGSS